jgi:hypothetical protein
MTALRPMAEAPRIDGNRILAWQKSRWGFPAYWRVIHWNNGIGKAGYTWPCWMCSVCTLSEKEEDFAGWVPLPEAPKEQMPPQSLTVPCDRSGGAWCDARNRPFGDDPDAIPDIAADRKSVR